MDGNAEPLPGSVEDVAAWCNLTPRRVQQLAKERILPAPDDGLYDIRACAMAYIRYLQGIAAGKGDNEQQAYQTQVTKERAEKLARENAVARGELIPKGDVTAGTQALVAHCRARLLAIPSKAAPAVIILESIPAIKELLTEHIHDALEELSRTRFISIRKGRRGAGDGAGADGRAGDHEAAAEANGKRVGRRKPDAKRRVKRRAGKVGHGKG